VRAILAILALTNFAYGENFDDLGQNLIRTHWHELQKSDQTANFRQLHQMTDIAEDAWFQVLQQKKDFLNQPSQDVFVAHYQAQALLRSRPLDFTQWIQAYVHLGQLMMKRPWDGLLIVKNFLEQWSVPLGIALFWVLLFHLWLWSRVLIADAPRWTRLKSKLTIFVALLALFISNWISGSVFWGLHLLLCLSIPYSRRPHLPAIGAVITAIFLSFTPFTDVFVETQQVGALNEALNIGRTRIEYSPTALQDLTPIQRAIWSSRNLDILAARHWLEKSPQGLERSALELEIRANDMSVSELTKAFEALSEKYPHQPMIQFNLVQLYTRGQELVKADQTRNQIEPTIFQLLSEWSSRTGRILVGPQNDPLKSPLFDFFQKKFRSKAAELGVFPFHWPKGCFYLMGFLLPWFLFFAGILHRRRASGLCAFTGDTSPSPMHEVSALYQSALQRKEPTAQAFRAQIEQSARAHLQLKTKQSKLWSFVMGGAYELVYEGALISPFIKSAILYSLIWFSLPLSTRYAIVEWMRVSLTPGFGPQGVFVPLAFISILFWVGLQIDRYRKAHR
jgi:hypothetical protein